MWFKQMVELDFWKQKARRKQLKMFSLSSNYDSYIMLWKQDKKSMQKHTNSNLRPKCYSLQLNEREQKQAITVTITSLKLKFKYL